MHEPYQSELRQKRAEFTASLPSDAEELWRRHPGKIGIVLSGGGARGAYEAGVLLAFQDAKLPTHVIAATSVGSINAASYAAHSETLVGNAEALVKSWSDVTPPAVGIDWFRYILVLGGLTAATAGFGNLAREWLSQRDIFVHSTQPLLTWFALGITGLAFLYFHDHVSYLWHVARNYWNEHAWLPDQSKVLKSIAGNIFVWGCIIFLLAVSHVHLAAVEALYVDWKTALSAVAVLALLAVLIYVLRQKVSFVSHSFLRLPLRTGLFPNYERTRFLRHRIPAEQLKVSPIRIAMTAADVRTGTERCFVNTGREELLRDRDVSAAFIEKETALADDPLLAVIASSAYPIVYEAVPIGGDLLTDGGIVSNQPIRPAIRLGADLLFLVMVEPRTQRYGEIATFLDLGVRAIDILMSQNLKTDLRMLERVNSLCEQYASEMGMRAEEVILQVGNRKYRYLKAFIVEPTKPLAASVLDFDGRITAPAILQGYRDGMQSIRELISYLETLPANLRKKEVKLVAETLTMGVGR